VNPDGRDVQAGLIDQMSYLRHVGRFLLFPVGGVHFNLQDLRIFPTYFVAFFCMHVGANFDFLGRPWVRLYLCSLMCSSKHLLVSPM
jgi:hypothetical protein